VFGGSQKRPNLHLQDMVDLYKLLLALPDERIAGQIFNAGFQNMSIMEIAQTVKRVVREVFPEKGEIPIVTTPTDDIRSYHVNSDKIQRALGFKPKHTVEDAVRDLVRRLQAGKLPNSMDDTFYFNVRRLKSSRPHDRPADRDRHGWCGFIGSHMVDVLVERGFSVRAIDNLAGGREENLASHRNNPDLVLEKRDIRNCSPDDRLFRGARYVFHFAGSATSSPPSSAPRVHVGQRSGHGTYARVRAARAGGEIRLCRSSSCYGLASVPTREDHPIEPRYPYALSKYLGEQAALHWHRVYKLPVNSIRIFNAYGTRSRTSAPMAPYSAFFYAKSWPADRTPSSATVRRPAISLT